MVQTRGLNVSGRIGMDKIILGFLAFLTLGAFFYLQSQRQQALRNSPMGLDGLQIWLSRSGQQSQNFSGGWLLDAKDIGLLIIPLYDANLLERRRPPRTQEELLMQQDEFDLDSVKTRRKADRVPTLIVLPKWRSGMRLTGLAHPFLVGDRNRIRRTARDLVDDANLGIDRAAQPFSTFRFDTVDGVSHEPLVYAAQTLSSSKCTPIIGTQAAMLLAECPLIKNTGTAKVYVLSDPDLINNHGLRLGENAYAIRDWIAAIAGERRVVIDYSRDFWLAEDAVRAQRDRTWEDLMRFFSPPFAFMWAGLVLAMALTLWRAAVRSGPLLASPDGLGAAKMSAIAARAKLMRLTNLDGALAREYCKARIAVTATECVGPSHGRQFAQPEVFLAYVKSRYARHVAPLAAVLKDIETLPESATPSQAISSVTALDGILERIRHDT